MSVQKSDLPFRLEIRPQSATSCGFVILRGDGTVVATSPVMYPTAAVALAEGTKAFKQLMASIS
jgi:hypothetical protein